MEEISNIGLLERVLDEMLPLVNKKQIEPYTELLQDLHNFRIIHTQDLKFLIEKHKPEILNSDRHRVSELKANQEIVNLEWYGTSEDRINKGVFFGHVGLAREALEFEFSGQWLEYNRKKY